MKKGIYKTLALSGIIKNNKLYFPYILTCIGTVMMCYIISFLSISEAVEEMAGGTTVQGFLSLGFHVMAVFSLIFLFYTNSFLIRRRKKEFGLYNILGVGKKNLALVLAIETLIISFISLGTGLVSGVFFSKLAELCIIKILSGNSVFAFHVDFKSIGQTAALFAIIFLLIYFNTLRQIHLTNPIELLHSENTGEKPPKANWLAAVIGIVLLAAAYYLALMIKDPLTAFLWFFIIVIMVIIATYMLFISGSVTLCRLLQKNKKYYYKTNHFVSVSSMTYRMKRNGAGLASVCILCTMVLVMMSSTVCLYIGAEDNLRNRYPRNISLDTTVENIDDLSDEMMKSVEQAVEESADGYGEQIENVQSYRTANLGGIIDGNIIQTDQTLYDRNVTDSAEIWQIFIVPLTDYNRLMGENETLNSGEALMYTTEHVTYDNDTIYIGETGESFRIKETVQKFIDSGIDSMQIFPTMYLFVSDFESTASTLKSAQLDGNVSVYLHWYYAFDLSCDDEAQILIYDSINERLSEPEISAGGCSIVEESVAKERADFYGLYGGLFFLGILLGVVFIVAAILIIYYKQVSEGYEDQARFEIMQKVGMTKKEIRKSINSQILTVFFMPLLTAGIHLGFAFPLIRKILLVFGLSNVNLLILTTVLCYSVFGAFYMIIYRMTSGAYYKIVSGMKIENE